MSSSYATAALIKELLGYQSPYSTIGQNILEQTKPYPYRMSLGSALGTGLATGLTAGGLAAYGKSQEEERNKTIAEALASEDPEAALNANPETRDLAPYFSMQKKEQEQEKQAQLQKLQATLLGKAVLYDPATGTAKPFQPMIDALAAQEGAKASAAAAARYPYQERLAKIRAQSSEGKPISQADLDYLNSDNPEQVPPGVSYPALRVKTNREYQAGIADRFENAALPEGATNKVNAAMEANEMLPLLIQRIKEFEGKPGINLTGLTRDKFLSSLPTSERSLFQNWLNFGAMEGIVGVLGKQGLSDRDLSTGLDFLANPEALVTGDLSPRFEKMLQKTRAGAVAALRTAKRQKKYKKSAEEVADEFLQTIPETERDYYRGALFDTTQTPSVAGGVSPTEVSFEDLVAEEKAKLKKQYPDKYGSVP